MQDNTLISMIIPVYNGEKTLHRAVESVLPQSNGSVEIILVNDGSTDGSGAVCDAYLQKSANVKVIHKINGGISSARNAGIAAAHGEYLMFLDADDFLDADTCDEIIKIIKAYQPDCIDFGWKYVSRRGEVTPNHHKIPKNVMLGKDVIRNDLLPPLLNLRHDPDHFIYDFSCTKVFRGDIIARNEVAFDENRRVWEDRPFVVRYLKFCGSFYSMDRCFYNYVDMPGSLSRKYSMDFFRIILENYQLYRCLYGQEYDFDTEYVNNYWCHAIENMIIRSLEQEENREQIRANILLTLRHPQVIHWHSQRKPNDRFEKRVTRMILRGQNGNACAEYEKRFSQKQRRQKYALCLEGIKNILKKHLNRG